jgi:hypothetical protein
MFSFTQQQTGIKIWKNIINVYKHCTCAFRTQVQQTGKLSASMLYVVRYDLPYKFLKST